MVMVRSLSSVTCVQETGNRHNAECHICAGSISMEADVDITGLVGAMWP
jgi:transcription elongation factor Elf1